MHIRGLIAAGSLLLTIASFRNPSDLFPMAVPYIWALLFLRDRAVYWTQSERDARLSSFMLDMLMGAVFVLSVGMWTIGPVLVMVGFVLNHIVILANGCAMPLLGSPDPPPAYVRIGPHTRLRWLSDIYITEGGLPHRALFSLGDAIITVGLWVFAAELVLP